MTDAEILHNLLRIYMSLDDDACNLVAMGKKKKLKKVERKMEIIQKVVNMYGYSIEYAGGFSNKYYLQEI